MSSNQINTELFNETEVIKSLKSKCQESTESLVVDKIAEQSPAKSNRGRKRKYATDEERILARRAQQKAYRDRKKLELAELRALKAQLDAGNTNNTA